MSDLDPAPVFPTEADIDAVIVEFAGDPREASVRSCTISLSWPTTTGRTCRTGLSGATSPVRCDGERDGERHLLRGPAVRSR